MEAVWASAPWIGRVLSGIAIAFLAVDTIGKLLRVTPVIEGTVKLGYPRKCRFPDWANLAGRRYSLRNSKDFHSWRHISDGLLRRRACESLPYWEPVVFAHPLCGLRRSFCLGRPCVAKSASVVTIDRCSVDQPNGLARSTLFIRQGIWLQNLNLFPKCPTSTRPVDHCQ